MSHLAASVSKASGMIRKVAGATLKQLVRCPTAAAALLAGDSTTTRSQPSAAAVSALKASTEAPAATAACDDAAPVNHRLASAATLDSTTLWRDLRSPRNSPSLRAPAGGGAVAGSYVTAVAEAPAAVAPIATPVGALSIGAASTFMEGSTYEADDLAEPTRLHVAPQGSAVQARVPAAFAKCTTGAAAGGSSHDVDVTASPLALVASALDVRHPLTSDFTSSYVANTAPLIAQRHASTAYGSIVDADGCGVSEMVFPGASRGPTAAAVRGAPPRGCSARLPASAAREKLTTSLLRRVQHHDATARVGRAHYNGLRGVATVSGAGRPVSVRSHLDLHFDMDSVSKQDGAAELVNMAAAAAARAGGAVAATPQDGAQQATKPTALEATVAAQGELIETQATKIMKLEADNVELKATAATQATKIMKLEADNVELKATVAEQGELIKTQARTITTLEAEAERLKCLAAARLATEVPVKAVLRDFHSKVATELRWNHRYTSISHLLEDLEKAANKAKDKGQVKKYRAFAAKVQAAATAALLTDGALSAIDALRGVANPIIHAQGDFETKFESAEAIKDAIRKGTLGMDSDDVEALVARVDEWYPAYARARAAAAESARPAARSRT